MHRIESNLLLAFPLLTAVLLLKEELQRNDEHSFGRFEFPTLNPNLNSKSSRYTLTLREIKPQD